jgi:hypothetical protein
MRIAAMSKRFTTLKQFAWFVGLYGISLVVIGGAMWLGHLLARLLA